ncbi:glycosyltransferase [candidate division WWE3 bacterium]|nr:glycosyltransferase [candidate division WWE3 bacterium]
MDIRNKTIVIVAHKFTTQPDDDLVKFLREKRVSNIFHIKHSFADAPDRKSSYVWYKEGKIYKEDTTSDFSTYPEIFIYIKEFYFTAFWLLSSKLKFDTYIGMDGLCIVFGLILKAVLDIKKIVFWAIDFVPNNRFSGYLKNTIYKLINLFAYKNVQEIWDLSPRMLEAREKFAGIKLKDDQLHKVVPYGVWHDEIMTYSYNECEKHSLVFMGHLIPKQGVQFVINAMPQILEHFPDFKFKIIGGGSYEPELKALATKLGVLDHCKFFGKIPNELHGEVLLPEIAKSCIAIAPYIKELDTWTYFADPGKVKSYLACGVPVLLTDLPWNAKEIKDHKCGLILSGEQSDLIEKISILMGETLNGEYRKNAYNYAKSFDYKFIFEDLFVL